MLISKVIDAIEAARAKHAADALGTKRSEGASLYDYGHLVGVYQGLGRALALIQSILDDEDENERRDD